MSAKQSHGVAILIDGDHVGAANWRDIKESAEEYKERIALVRIFSNKQGVGAIPLWVKTMEQEGFTLPWHISPRATRNAADILLTISALELAFERELSSFLIVSNDSGFDSLAAWLRTKGFQAKCLTLKKNDTPTEESRAVEQDPPASPPKKAKAKSPKKQNPKPSAEPTASTPREAPKADVEATDRMLEQAFGAALKTMTLPEDTQSASWGQVKFEHNALRAKLKKEYPDLPSFEEIVSRSKKFKRDGKGRKGVLVRM